MGSMPIQSPTRSRDDDGFVLIIAIVLMAFILMLLLGLSAMVRVDFAVVQISGEQLKARQNAIMGLKVALGEIQRSSGQDQRITARADVIGSSVKNPYWTGVWRSDDSSSPPVWLVSGNEGMEPGDPDYVSPTDELPDPASGNETVWLLKDAVGDPGQRVKVPVSSIAGDGGGQTGTYGFWVADEGVKAKFNIPSQSNASSLLPGEEDPHTTIAHNFGIELVAEEFAGAGLEEQASTGRATGLGEVSLAVGEDGIGEHYFHDMTAWSSGVLADVKNGGLKKDLTYAFEDDSTFTREFGNASASTPDQTLFFLDGVVDNGKLTGPNWSTLRSYYKLYQQLVSDVEVGLQAPWPSLNTSLRTTYFPYKHGVIDGYWTDAYHKNSPLNPVLSKIQIDVKIRTVPAGPGEGTGFPNPYKVRLEIKPTFALYNPYNIRLSSASYRINWEINPVFRVTLGNRTIEFDFEELGFHQTGHDFIIMTTSEADFQPGETLFFSTAVAELWGKDNYYKLLENTLAEDGVLFHTLTEGLDEDAEGSDAPIIVDGSESIQVLDVTLNNDAYIALKQIVPGVGEVNLQRMPRLWQSGTGKTPGVATGFPAYPAASYDESIYFASWVFQAQTTTEPDGLRVGIDSNLRALAGDTAWDGFENGSGKVAISPLSTAGSDNGLLSGGVPYEPETAGDDDGRYEGLWGNSVSAGGQEHSILFNVPRTPLLSLGELQHANLSRYSHQPAFVIGNSYANPRIALSETIEKNFSEPGLDVYDLPYLVNDQIWDSYFFSSIDPNLSSVQLDELLQNQTLRNRRYVFNSDSSQPLDSTLFEEARTGESEYDALASWLMVNGPFNVNSTSVEAWVAVLGAMQNLALPIYDAATGAVSTVEADTYFSRFGSPYGEGYDSSESSTYGEFWKGYRHLSSDQIRALAEKIVDKIKLRGRPFLSLGEFVNRSLEDNPSDPEDTRLRGILQAALDSPDVKINSSLDSSLGMDAVDLSGGAFYNNMTASQAAGFPGYLLQGDLLQALGPILTVRSDTFLIRAYGSYRNPITQALAEAYCEAVVQRLPEPVEGDPTASVNRANPVGDFGRRYRVVSFRWLDKDEV